MTSSHSFTDAIYEATKYALRQNERLRVLGLGASYRGGADGTLGDLGQLYPGRVLDTPVSEAAVTGMALGAAIAGMPVVVHHGRVEFALFAIDQIVTQSAKWNFMFGRHSPIPLTLRIALGRQWGNGPQHTQHLPGLWGGITGMRVVVPSSPRQAAKLIYGAIRYPEPIVFLEPRWLYKTLEKFSLEEVYAATDPFSPRVLTTGNDFTFVSYGEGIVELLKLADRLETAGESADVIDLVSINPLDVQHVLDSVSKTGRLVLLDMGGAHFNVASEVLAQVIRRAESSFSDPPLVVSVPHEPVPTASNQTETYYPNEASIAGKFNSHFARSVDVVNLSFDEIHLPPVYQFSLHS